MQRLPIEKVDRELYIPWAFNMLEKINAMLQCAGSLYSLIGEWERVSSKNSLYTDIDFKNI